MHVVLDGLFGKIQFAGDLFVRPALRDKGYELLLPARQSELYSCLVNRDYL